MARRWVFVSLTDYICIQYVGLKVDLAHSATDPKRGRIPLIVSASGVILKRVRDARHFGISQQAGNDEANDKLEEEDGDNDDYLLNDDDHQSDTHSHTSVAAGRHRSKTPSTQGAHNRRPMSLKASQRSNIAHASGPPSAPSHASTQNFEGCANRAASTASWHDNINYPSNDSNTYHRPSLIPSHAPNATQRSVLPSRPQPSTQVRDVSAPPPASSHHRVPVSSEVASTIGRKRRRDISGDDDLLEMQQRRIIRQLPAGRGTTFAGRDQHVSTHGTRHFSRLRDGNYDMSSAGPAEENSIYLQDTYEFDVPATSTSQPLQLPTNPRSRPSQHVTRTMHPSRSPVHPPTAQWSIRPAQRIPAPPRGSSQPSYGNSRRIQQNAIAGPSRYYGHLTDVNEDEEMEYGVYDDGDDVQGFGECESDYNFMG